MMYAIAFLMLQAWLLSTIMTLALDFANMLNEGFV